MPTYTYRCKKCGETLERYQSIIDPPLTVCPYCGGELERVITGGSGLIFKGSGFYITDYKNKKSVEHRKPAKKEQPAKQPAPDRGSNTAKEK
ncbi:MAG TPA: zinc ribbon domain-containing protein [Caldithrix sp.]|nr:zinc ribbon domain-containing protein [Caldithrix sp.]